MIESVFWIIDRLQLIGEASNHFSDELIKQNQDIPCADIVGLRNILVHHLGSSCKR